MKVERAKQNKRGREIKNVISGRERGRGIGEKGRTGEKREGKV